MENDDESLMRYLTVEGTNKEIIEMIATDGTCMNMNIKWIKINGKRVFEKPTSFNARE